MNPSWIQSRCVLDTIIIDDYTYQRKIELIYNEKKYKITWYIFKHGKQIVKDANLFTRLENIYQKYQDKPNVL